jgi:putative peptide maturation system protein
MTEDVRSVAIHALDYLVGVSHDGLGPDEAAERLRAVAARHPEVRVDLVWDEEAYSRSVHYDVLLRSGGLGTVSISVCPDRGLPWPLRGVHRWREQELVRVNGTVLRVAQAVACLEFIWGVAPITRRLVDVCLVQEALAEAPQPISAAELQTALDDFRRAHALHGAEETARWMERQGLTHDRLERHVAEQVCVAKLRDRIAAGRIEEYFERHRAEFDVAHAARIPFPSEESAARAVRQIRGGRLEFYQAAEEWFLSQRPSTTRPRDLFVAVRRGQLSPEGASAVFEARPGTVVGPVRNGAGYSVVRVLSIAPARLDEPTRAEITTLLFEEWLAQRREAAAIEWYWGTQAGQPGLPQRC